MSKPPGFVDVHCHLIHAKFSGIEDEVVLKSVTAGLEYIVVNGLEPISNRAVMVHTHTIHYTLYTIHYTQYTHTHSTTIHNR